MATKKIVKKKIKPLLMPFGQYQGMPVELLNRNYREWLLAVVDFDSNPKWLKIKPLLQDLWERDMENDKVANYLPKFNLDVYESHHRLVVTSGHILVHEVIKRLYDICDNLYAGACKAIEGTDEGWEDVTMSSDIYRLD